MLSYRAGIILNAIVGQYITRAVPVASQSLANDPELKVSPATIRNEMALLEQEGYIIRPYASSGSIPSDKGYRYYVDSLTDIELPLVEQRMIHHLFHQVEGELEHWLSLAATIIAKLAQNMAIVTKPKSTDSRVKYIDLVSIQDSLALLILVLYGATVRQHLISFDQAITQQELSAVANKLNEAYCGLSKRQITAKDIALSPIGQMVTDCLLEIMQAEDEQKYDEPYLDGRYLMLSQPEFTHSERALALMEMVEHRNLSRIIAPRGFFRRGVQVTIGRENKAEVMNDLSVVISQYGLPEEAAGTISVVGPTRMPYPRAISAVAYIASVLNTLVAELYRKEGPAPPSEHSTN